MNSGTQKSMNIQEWLLLLLLSMLWGGSFFFVGVAVKALPPLTIVALRVAMAAVTLLVVMSLFRQRFPRSPQIWLLSSAWERSTISFPSL